MSRWRVTACACLGYAFVAIVLGVGLLVLEPVAVSGGSMHPVLHHGDLALVRRGARGASGDIVLLRSAGHSAVLHRMVRTTAVGSVVTRGDANPVADFETAAPDEVAGVVVAIVPAGRLMERWRERGIRATLSAQSYSAR